MSETPKVVTWFEIPSTDYERAVRFYEAVIGERLTPHDMNGTRMALFPHADEVPSGAVLSCPTMKPSADGLNVYIWVGDAIDPVLARAEAAGGRVAAPKEYLGPEIGWVAHIIDTEGNRIGLHARG